VADFDSLVVNDYQCARLCGMFRVGIHEVPTQQIELTQFVQP